jgi:hypothetical protein
MAATLRATQPISFHLFDRDGHSTLAMFDGKKGQTSTLEIINSSRRDLKPKKLPGADPIATNHHFELRFRYGTLTSTAASQITVDAGDAGWKISKAVETGDGLSFYLLIANPAVVKSGKAIAVKVNNLNADSTGGSRGTRVELKWPQGSLEYVADGAQPESLTAGHRVQHLDIVDQRGEQHIPLHVGIVGANKITNDGQENIVKLRITNVLKPGEGNIQLTEKGGQESASQFLFSFDASDKQEWALATKSQVAGIHIKAVAGGKEFAKKEPKQGETAVWSVWPTEAVTLAPDDYIEVTMSNIKTTVPSGPTNVYIQYKNIPGYWDGSFVCVIEKAPVVYKDGKVGIGTISPLGPLSVGDASVANSDGFIVIGKKSGTDTRQYKMGFDSNFNFVIGDYGANNVAGTWSSPFAIKWNAPSNSLSISGSGNVGIGTTSEPRGKLDVNGKLRVEGAVSVGGSGALEVDAVNVVGGRLKIDSDGKVGIGTASPGSNINTGEFFGADKSGRILDVYSADNEAVLILSSNQNKNAAHIGGVYFTRTGGQGDAHREVAAIKCRQYSTGNLAGGLLQFYTKPSGSGLGFDAPRMVILDNGRVGIGTPDPQATLHVNGEVRIGVDKELFFQDNGQIRSADDNHRILFHRTSNKMELREYGDIIFSPGSGGNATNKVVMKSNGRVGINQPDPTVPLDVKGFGNIHMEKGFWFAFRNESRHSNNTYDNSVSIRAEWGVLSDQAMYVISDLRTKTDFRTSDPVADLATLSRLRVTDFKYVDHVTRGTESRKGLIAQHVEQVFPLAVSRLTGVVPDIYQPAAHAEGWIELANDLKEGDCVRLIFEENDGIFEVLEATPNKFRTDFKPVSDEVFVYGREVKDFRALDYDSIAVLNVSATQQLKKEMDQEVKALRAENAELRAANDALAQRLQLLESKMEAVLSVMGATNGNGKRTV